MFSKFAKPVTVECPAFTIEEDEANERDIARQFVREELHRPVEFRQQQEAW